MTFISLSSVNYKDILENSRIGHYFLQGLRHSSRRLLNRVSSPEYLRKSECKGLDKNLNSAEISELTVSTLFVCTFNFVLCQ